MRRLNLLGFACLLVLASALPAFAATHTVVLGSTYASAPPGGSPGSIAATNSDFFTGTGCWSKSTVSPKFEMYLSPSAMFGTTFTVADLATMTYHTRNVGNPSGVDFTMLIYTAPMAGGDTSWYGRRLTAEPYLSNSWSPSFVAWNTWATGPGSNQLTFYDSNHCGNFGFYGAPTLANLQAGPITWNAWPTNLGSGDGTPQDYRPQVVNLISLQTGSGWSSFVGAIDAISWTVGAEVYVVDLENTPDNAVSPAAPATCLTPAHPCVTVPVNIARTDLTGIRGYSVDVLVSGNLALCNGPLSDISQGTYLSGVGSTNYEVVDNGGGSYTVDCAILSATSGATASAGNLFNLSLKATGGDGTGTVTVTSVTLRDPNNGPILATAGAPASVTIDYTPPAAPSALAASQLKVGNDGDGTTKVQLTFTAPALTTVEVYRAGFGGYPEYDDAGGAPPATPSYPPSGAWSLTGVTASGQYDETTNRDFWYYVAFAKDACGNVSAVSNKTTGTLNYHLGDVVDPSNALSLGDNHVDGADISRLGNHYGISLVLNDPYNYLDVGPTSDFSVNARPTTDNKVGFEDLILFAINYGLVSAPQFEARPAAAGSNAIALEVPELPAAGGTFAVSVRMQGAGDVQGASVHLGWDAAVVEPVGIEAGGLLQSQGRGSVALSPEPGVVDFALLGMGGGLAGNGEVARVLFRVKGAGAAGITLGSVSARDDRNQIVALGQLASSNGGAVPARTELGPVFPNPALHSASLQLSLARESSVRVALYDLAGRRVRTLIDSVQPAGVRIVTWNGMNDSGVRMAPGVYVMRLEAAGVAQSRRLQFLP